MYENELQNNMKRTVCRYTHITLYVHKRSGEKENLENRNYKR